MKLSKFIEDNPAIRDNVDPKFDRTAILIFIFLAVIVASLAFYLKNN